MRQVGQGRGRSQARVIFQSLTDDGFNLILHQMSGVHRGRGDELPYFYTSHPLARASVGYISARALQLSIGPLEHADKVVTTA